MTTLKSYRGRYLVDPLHDPDYVEQFPSLIVPLIAFQNPEPQQGIVVSAGSGCTFPAGSHIFFRPYRNRTVRYGSDDYLSVTEGDTCARILDGRPVPKWGTVIVEPEFPEVYETSASGRIVLPKRLDDFTNPRTGGTIITVGPDCGELVPGTRVLFDPAMGIEFGFRDKVVYIIEVKDLWGTLV